MVPPSPLLPVGRMYGASPYGGFWSWITGADIVAGHTGGTVTLPSGEVISSDEQHRRLCEAGVLTGSTCDLSPSEMAAFHADLPEGWWETVLEGTGGYEFRHDVQGTKPPTDPGSEIDWKRVAFVGVSGVVLLLILGKK